MSNLCRKHSSKQDLLILNTYLPQFLCYAFRSISRIYILRAFVHLVLRALQENKILRAYWSLLELKVLGVCISDRAILDSNLLSLVQLNFRSDFMD